MADSNIKAAPSLGDKPDTLAASVDNSANDENAKQIEGLVLGAPVIFTGVSHHPLVEGIAERAGFVSKVIDDVEGVAIVTVFTNDPTLPVHTAQAKYSKEVGSHGTFRLASDIVEPLVVAPIDTRTAQEVADANTPASSKRGTSTTVNGG